MNRTKTGSGDKMIDWIVIVGAILLFTKTAEVLSYFAPTMLNEIFGVDVSILYGMVCATLVEGLALSLHFNRRTSHSSSAQIVKWILIAISGVCQIFDGFLVTGSVSTMSDTLKAVLAFGVPLVPLLVVTMIFAIGQLPELESTEVRPGSSLGMFMPTSANRFGSGYMPPIIPSIGQSRESSGLSNEFKPPNPNGSKDLYPTNGEERS
jgi:hypothetical protein